MVNHVCLAYTQRKLILDGRKFFFQYSSRQIPMVLPSPLYYDRLSNRPLQCRAYTVGFTSWNPGLDKTR